MNLNQLEYFVCAAETLNFTKAAAKCFITQTAMTQQIKALETAVGVPLFLRDKHHVELTPAGQVYLLEAKKILDQSEEALRLARLASNGESGEITIGFISGFGESDAPDLLKKFHMAYPGIKMKMVRDTMSGLMSALEKGDCDIAFTISSNSFQKKYPNTSQQFINSYPLMAVLPNDHPLVAKETVSYSDLSEENFIIMQPSARSKEEMEEVILMYKRGGFVPNIVAYEKEPEAIFLMVSIGIGVCLMPEYIIRRHRNNQNFKIVPLIKEDGCTETIDFDIAWKTNSANPAVKKLVDLCTK